MIKKALGAVAAASLVALAPPAAAISQDATGAAAGALPNVAYSGLSFGTQVSALSGTISSGKTAPSSVGCTNDGGKRKRNTVAGVNLPVVGKVGAVNTLAQTTETSTWKRTNTRAEVAGINLLGGQIKADAIKTNASAYARAGDVRTGANSMSLVNLTVAGKTIPAKVGKNTKVTIPGVAEVTLNKQTRSTNKSDRYTVSTTGISVRILPDNPLGLPTTTKIDVASARASLDIVDGEELHSGTGFSTRVKALGGAVKSGATAAVSMPCTGGTKRNNIADVRVPLLVNTGTTSSVATGATSDTREWSRVINRTASPRLLGGLITADALVADTTVSKSKSTGQIYSRDNSSFVGLRVAGRKVADVDLAPNSTIEIPGIAKVTVHQQLKGSKSLTVTMLRVELLDGLAGLPVGSVIEVGYSRSALR